MHKKQADVKQALTIGGAGLGAIAGGLIGDSIAPENGTALAISVIAGGILGGYGGNKLGQLYENMSYTNRFPKLPESSSPEFRQKSKDVGEALKTKGGLTITPRELLPVGYGSKEIADKKLKEARQYRKDNPDITFVQNLSDKSLDQNVPVTAHNVITLIPGAAGLNYQRYPYSLDFFANKLRLGERDRNEIQLQYPTRDGSNILDNLIHESIHSSGDSMTNDPKKTAKEKPGFIFDNYTTTDRSWEGIRERLAEDSGPFNMDLVDYAFETKERETRITLLKRWLQREKGLDLDKMSKDEIKDVFVKYREEVPLDIRQMLDTYKIIDDKKLKNEIIDEVKRKSPGVVLKGLSKLISKMV